jgi:hypothetical protein
MTTGDAAVSGASPGAYLLHDFGDNTGAHGTATLTDSET